jgi:hypothetical protein
MEEGNDSGSAGCVLTDQAVEAIATFAIDCAGCGPSPKVDPPRRPGARGGRTPAPPTGRATRSVGRPIHARRRAK